MPGTPLSHSEKTMVLLMIGMSTALTECTAPSESMQPVVANSNEVAFFIFCWFVGLLFFGDQLAKRIQQYNLETKELDLTSLTNF